jgi:hypothetical protein
LTLLVLFGLVLIWAVVLAPPLLRARTSRSSDSIVDFKHRLGVLSRTNGAGHRLPIGRRPALPALSPPVAAVRGPVAPYGAPVMTASQRATKRRRDITLGLGATAILTLAFAVLGNRQSLWLLHGVVDVLLIAYLGLVAYFRSLQMERHATVRYMAPRRAPQLALQTASDLPLRRTASS